MSTLSSLLKATIACAFSISAANAFFWSAGPPKISQGMSTGTADAAAAAALAASCGSPPVPQWNLLKEKVSHSATGDRLDAAAKLREQGVGDAHQDAKLRLFGTTSKPRVVLYRDTAAWCPYCQKVWILLEKKKIPYAIEKINMRSYGDKPAEFLRLVPNGLLPAVAIDGSLQTESLDIMLNLDQTFTGPAHGQLWPSRGSSEESRAVSLMRLERDLFSRWCNLVFRPSSGDGARRTFEQGLDEVNKQLLVTPSPWFLQDFSIVDLTYITHIERMCASVAYWSGFKMRGDGRWPAIERWMDAFEQMPEYIATKSDYYTHVMDIPPQYGPGYSAPGSDAFAARITGRDGSWKLPLPPLTPADLEPIGPTLDPGDEAARHEAAYKLSQNHEACTKFALRACGSPGRKQFQAPLADPYAVPNLEHLDSMDACLRLVTWALLDSYDKIESVDPKDLVAPSLAARKAVKESLLYLRDRVGVPRDMSYPAARQLRAHLNWVAEKL